MHKAQAIALVATFRRPWEKSFECQRALTGSFYTLACRLAFGITQATWVS